jgi:TonB family protein
MNKNYARTLGSFGYSILIHIILLLISSFIYLSTPFPSRVSFTEITVIGVSPLGNGLGMKISPHVKEAIAGRKIVGKNIYQPEGKKSESGVVLPKIKGKTEEEIVSLRKTLPIGIQEYPQEVKSSCEIGDVGISTDTGKVGVPWGKPNITGVVAQRGIRKEVIPEYPEWARRKGIEGEIIVGIYVTPSGKVKDNVELIKKSGCKELDEIVINAVKKWEFDPLPPYIKQEDQYGHIPFRFKLKP